MPLTAAWRCLSLVHGFATAFVPMDHRESQGTARHGRAEGSDFGTSGGLEILTGRDAR
jgi:hypothetical protein